MMRQTPDKQVHSASARKDLINIRTLIVANDQEMARQQHPVNTNQSQFCLQPCRGLTRLPVPLRSPMVDQIPTSIRRQQPKSAVTSLIRHILVQNAADMGGLPLPQSVSTAATSTTATSTAATSTTATSTAATSTAATSTAATSTAATSDLLHFEPFACLSTEDPILMPMSFSFSQRESTKSLLMNLEPMEESVINSVQMPPQSSVKRMIQSIRSKQSKKIERFRMSIMQLFDKDMKHDDRVEQMRSLIFDVVPMGLETDTSSSEGSFLRDRESVKSVDLSLQYTHTFIYRARHQKIRNYSGTLDRTAVGLAPKHEMPSFGCVDGILDSLYPDLMNCNKGESRESLVALSHMFNLKKLLNLSNETEDTTVPLTFDEAFAKQFHREIYSGKLVGTNDIGSFFPNQSSE